MEILNSGILNSLSKDLAQTLVQIQFTKDVPPEVLNTLQRLQVTAKLQNDILLLQLENGQTLPAKITPPLDVGTRLTALIKSASNVLVRQVFQSTSANPSLPLNTSNIQIPEPQLQSQNQAIPVRIQQVNFPLQHAPTFTLPPLKLDPPLPLNTPLQSTILSAPNQQSGQQTLQITLPNQTTPIQISAQPSVPLPIQTNMTFQQPATGPAQVLQLTFPANPDQPIQIPALASQTTTAQATQPAIPTPAQVQIQQPLTPQTLQALQNLPTQIVKTTFNGETTPLTPPLAPPAGQTTPLTVQQPVTLPTGQKLMVNLPQTVPEGTQMTIRIGADGLPQVMRISTGNNLNQSGSQAGQPFAGSQPHAPTQTAPTLTPGTQSQGLITAQAPGNQMILTLSSGQQLQVHTEHPLPTGTQVTFTMKQDGTAEILNLTLPAGTERAQIAYQLGKEWPILKQAVNTLKQHNPTAAQELQQALPTPQTLLPSLIKFADALAMQSAERLLGDDTVQLLRSLGIDLTPDIQSLNQLQQKPDTLDGWRGMLFPYVEDDGDPQQGGFFWRRQKDENEEEQNIHGFRFVVQLSLSQFGPIQLDGLMNEQTILLKLRLQSEPGESFRTGLDELVQNTLAAYGLEGQISLEIQQNFPTDPLSDIQHHAGHMDLKA